MLAATPAPVLAERVAAGCLTPSFQVVVDVAGSRPLAPRLTLHAENLSVPAMARFDWGNGQFGVAAIDTANGHAPRSQIDPIYATAGTYRLTLSVVDACAQRWILAYSVTVPLVLTPARVSCPGIPDADGVCVVPPDVARTFTVTDAAGRGGAWHWAGTLVSGRVSGPDASDYRLSLPMNHPVVVQATRCAPEGWHVSSPLTVVARPTALPQISAYIQPDLVRAGERVTLGFAIPAGSDGARPSIVLDGQVLAHAREASARLAEGDHDVTYQLSYPDGAVVRRQVIVSARPAGLPDTPLILAAAFGSGVAIIAWRRRRGRNHPGDPVHPARDSSAEAAGDAVLPMIEPRPPEEMIRALQRIRRMPTVPAAH